MVQDIRLFACDYDRYQNKFGYFAYADRIPKDVQKELCGKRFMVRLSSYPFYFNHLTMYREIPINIGIETTSGAIAKKIMARLYEMYCSLEARMQNDETISCLHEWNDLSIEHFTIDTEKGIIDNVFIGS